MDDANAGGGVVSGAVGGGSFEGTCTTWFVGFCVGVPLKLVLILFGGGGCPLGIWNLFTAPPPPIALPFQSAVLGSDTETKRAKRKEILYHIILHHIISYYIVLYYVISYHIISCCNTLDSLRFA